MNASKPFRLVVLALSLLAISSCSMFRPHGPKTEPTSPTQTATQTSEAPATESIIPPKVEPPKPGSERRKITLVLGGAGVSTFATVGLLKRFHEEGIEIDSIVTTGWPTLFALAGGFLKSIHDVEWFAMRLNEKDFRKISSLDPGRVSGDQEKLSNLIENTFKQTELNDSKFPIVISSANTEGDESDVYDRGDWRIPLLKTMSVPGIFRPYPQGVERSWLQSLRGVDVTVAKYRGAQIIVAVEMYKDYFDFLYNEQKDSSDGFFRQTYLTTLKNSISRELNEATVTGHIHLQTSPTNFSQKRKAILQGYREGARLAKAIRALNIN